MAKGFSLLCHFVIIVLALPVLAGTIRAQGQTAVPAELFTAIQKREFVTQYLKGKDPSKITAEELTGLVEQARIQEQALNEGSMEEKNGEYIFRTGLKGDVTGSIPKGLYEVSVKRIDGVIVRTRRVVAAGSNGSRVLDVGMEETTGKGNVTFVSRDRLDNALAERSLAAEEFMRSLSDKLPFLPKRQVKRVPTIEALPRSLLTVRLHRDTNKNGTFDVGEDPVPWANVVVMLRKISTETPLTLVSGENTVRFVRTPYNMRSASMMLSELVLSGVPEAEISTTHTGSLLTAVHRNKQFYGEDFALQPGTDYTVTVPTDITVFQLEPR